MNWKIKLLEVALKMLTSGDVYDIAKNIVHKTNKLNLTGTQKKDIVFKELTKLFTNYSTTILNILIEVAVFSLKKKLSKV